MTKLTQYLGKRILVSLVRDEDVEPRTFTLVAIEEFGLWLEPVEVLPKATTSRRAPWPTSLARVALVPFAQIAYVLGEGASVGSVVNFAERAKPGDVA